MGEARYNPNPLPRLEPIIEHRIVGLKISRETGMPEPDQRAFIVGHGQQIARRDAEAKALANRNRLKGVSTGFLSRPVRRHGIRSPGQHA
jgi:hypothetical protein